MVPTPKVKVTVLVETPLQTWLEQYNDFIFHYTVLEWSQVNKFELVQMETTSLSDMDEASENNIYGINRLVEALHTHLWPNRILKGNVTFPWIAFNTIIDSLSSYLFTANSRTVGVTSEEDVNKVKDQLGRIRLSMTAHNNSDQLLMESVLG